MSIIWGITAVVSIFLGIIGETKENCQKEKLSIIDLGLQPIFSAIAMVSQLFRPKLQIKLLIFYT